MDSHNNDRDDPGAYGSMTLDDETVIIYELTDSTTAWIQSSVAVDLAADGQ